MPANITPQLPSAGSDQRQYAQLPPAAVAYATTASTVTTSAATAITLNASTSLIEVTVCAATSLNGVYMRYQASASSSTFDEYVAPGTRHYVVPTGVTVISYRADGASAEVRTIEK
jgi:hypothetical protein